MKLFFSREEGRDTLLKYFDHPDLLIQGGFFHWYPPTSSKCQPVSKFSKKKVKVPRLVTPKNSMNKKLEKGARDSGT